MSDLMLSLAPGHRLVLPPPHVDCSTRPACPHTATHKDFVTDDHGRITGADSTEAAVGYHPALQRWAQDAAPWVAADLVADTLPNLTPDVQADLATRCTPDIALWLCATVGPMLDAEQAQRG